MTGIIIKAVGGIYTVEASDGVYQCKARGIFRKRNISPVCGDRVTFTLENDGTGVIEGIGERKSLLIRPPLANLDALVFVSSTCEPKPNLLLLDKFIAIAVFKKIEPIIAFTKVDKTSAKELADIYRRSGFKVYEVDNTTGEGAAELKSELTGKLSAFTGNTGVGKSSLLNCLFPQLALATAEISKKLGRGRHTTRTVELYKLPDGGYIADTPGFSSFDTNRYDIILKDQLADCFAEFAPYKDKCRFQNCSHTKEKGCAVLEAVNSGEIPRSRHESYVDMYEQAKQIKEWEVGN
ncbi:MAG: ribosome small subunit-dependent GTPase A [Ruminococcus sp.]|nr:ribosome small subunit-dependent GTPase A [Ruminococcus sp.]